MSPPSFLKFWGQGGRTCRSNSSDVYWKFVKIGVHFWSTEWSGGTKFYNSTEWWSQGVELGKPVLSCHSKIINLMTATIEKFSSNWKLHFSFPKKSYTVSTCIYRKQTFCKITPEKKDYLKAKSAWITSSACKCHNPALSWHSRFILSLLVNSLCPCFKALNKLPSA